MKNVFIILLIIVGQFSMLKAEKIDYELMIDVKVKRMNEYLIRYYRTMKGKNIGYLDSIAFVKDQQGKNISPTDWKIYKTMEISKISGVYYNDFTDAEIVDLEFKVNSVHMLISTTPLEPRGEEIRACIVYVNNGEFSNLECEEPQLIAMYDN